MTNENNNGLVSYYKLQERLISTGKLDAGGSVLMIEHMEKAGKIEKTEEYNVYKIGNQLPQRRKKSGAICDNYAPMIHT